MLECGEEKVLTLTGVERIKALAAQLVKLLRAQKDSSLPVSQLLSEYSKTFGYGLRLQDYDASSLPALLAKLCHVVKVGKVWFYWKCNYFISSPATSKCYAGMCSISKFSHESPLWLFEA